MMRDRVDGEVDVYRRRVVDVMSEIRSWVAQTSALVASDQTIAIAEEHAEYEALGLRIVLGKRNIAQVVPVGTFVIGARGRIDVIGSSDRAMLLYLEAAPRMETTIRSEDGEILSHGSMAVFRGIEHAGWYWIVDPRRREARMLDRSTFLEILAEVADYEVEGD